MSYHRHLKDVVEDQMTLASIHYLRSHYQEAIDIYKALLAKNRDFSALHVYVALCYYKLDYYDVSQEVLGTYMQVGASSLYMTYRHMYLHLPPRLAATQRKRHRH
jgi:intraflagellar transport protein 56